MSAITGRRRWSAAVVVLCGWSATVMAQVNTLPYTNGTFDTDLDVIGQLPYGHDDPPATWTTNGGGEVKISNTTKAAGTKSCYIEANTLNLNFSYADRSNTWVRMFCKPAPYDDGSSQPSASSCSAAFYVSTNGKLYAYAELTAGNGWTNVASDLSTNDWLGFTVHLDYSNKLWDIYYCTNDNLTTTNMIKSYDAPLRMAAGHSNRLWQVSVSCGATSYLDEVTVANGYSDLTYNLESLANVQYLASLTIPRGLGARTIAKYFGPSSDALSQELGNLLSQALNVDDQIRMYYTGVGWGIYSNEVTGWVNKYTGSGPEPEDAHVTPTTGLWFDDTLAQGTATVLGFAPYDSFDPTNTTLHTGWNLFQWPYAARSVNDAKTLGFPAVAGDLMYIYQSGIYKRLWYDAVAAKWMQGGSVSAYSIQEGQGFWYKRSAGGGNGTWDVVGAK